jgi:acyl-coenzyme A thioesterase PaaI-like protein
MSEISLADANAMLEQYFAPWIQDLKLSIEEIGGGRVKARLPFNERLSRVGGMVCGQAMMAVADTAMVFAVSGALGEFRDMATVSQSTSFFRPLAGKDMICEVRLMKQGRSLVFGEATLYADGDTPERAVAQATMTYALAPPKA